MVVIEASRKGRPGLARLEKTDADAATSLFSRLSPESVYRRFFAPVSRPELLRASLLQIDQCNREAVASVEGGEVVGIAQYSRLHESRYADLAIVVADEWQRQGLGTRLVAALAKLAADQGIEGFEVDIQGDNYGALRLLKRCAPGVRLAFSAGIGEALIPLPRDGEQ